ncbi:MAG: hypothetical protein JJU15_14450 [Pararhodobacter sp.]|nr:hypothetical protein [Pararhodobacter sp.]
MSIQIGISTGYREVVVRAADQGPRSNWYFGEEGLLAVDAINDPCSFMIAKRALQEATQVNPSAVTHPSVDLKSSLMK